MESKEFLADSDFFIALYRLDDTNHKHAIGLLSRIEKEHASLALSILAYSETATVLSQRVGQAVVRDFISDIEQAGVRIIHTTELILKKTKEVFRDQRSKNVSFTDAGNIALMRMEGFDGLISFDSDYRKNGVKIFV